MPKAPTPPKVRTAPRRTAPAARTSEPPALDTPTAANPLDGLFVPATERKEYLRVLYYGKEGSGKTTAALGTSRRGKTLVVDAEGGLKTAALAKLGVDLDQVVTFAPPVGAALTHQLLDQVYLKVRADLERDPDAWYAVVLDSITDIVASLVGHVSDDRVEKARRQGRTIDEIDAFFVDRSDYGTMTKMARDILRKFRNLPVNLVVTALERRDVDEDTGLTMYGPDVPPSFANSLVGYVDIVAACIAGMEDKPFRAVSKGANRRRVKDRFNALPRVLVDPSFDRIARYVEGELTEDTDPLQADRTPNTEPTQEPTKK